MSYFFNFMVKKQQPIPFEEYENYEVVESTAIKSLKGILNNYKYFTDTPDLFLNKQSVKSE